MSFKWKNGYFFALTVIVLCFVGELQADNTSETSNIPAPPVVFTSQVKNVPEQLLNKIAEYWGYKGSLQFKKAYNLEAPHTKYQFSLKKYLRIHKKARKLNTVLLLNVNDSYDLVVIRLKTVFAGKIENSPNNNSHIVTERWIKLENTWHHVFRNSFLNIY